MAFYRLKAGSHTSGEGQDLKTYNAKDPTRNIVESDQDLAERDPGKFEKHEGPPPPRARKGARRQEPLPPPAPGPAEFAEAALARPMTTEERKQTAQRLREQADQLEKEAQEGEAAQQQSQAQEESQQQEEQAGRETEGEDLETLTIPDLQELAEEEEIDLRGATRKSDIIAAIRKARQE